MKVAGMTGKRSLLKNAMLRNNMETKESQQPLISIKPAGPKSRNISQTLKLTMIEDQLKRSCLIDTPTSTKPASQYSTQYPDILSKKSSDLQISDDDDSNSEQNYKTPAFIATGVFASPVTTDRYEKDICQGSVTSASSDNLHEITFIEPTEQVTDNSKATGLRKFKHESLRLPSSLNLKNLDSSSDNTDESTQATPHMTSPKSLTTPKSLSKYEKLFKFVDNRQETTSS
jgi:hypothetical protein